MKHNLLPRLCRILALALLAAMLLSVFAGCGTRPEDGRVIVTVDGIKFTFDEFRYFFMNTKAELDGGDETVWEGNEELRNQLIADMELRLKRVAAIYHMAEEYEIELTSEDEAVIKEHIQQIRNTFESEEAFQEMLASEYTSEYTLEQVLRTQYLYELIREHATDEKNFLIRADDESLYADLETNFWRGAQILIRNDEGDDETANKKLAEDVLAKLEGGESFFRLVGEYGEDPGMRGNENGYYFTAGQLLSYFENEVKNLEEGEHTGVVECVHGYAIIMRLPMEQDYIKGHLEELRDAMMIRIFEEMLEEVTGQMLVETTTLYYQYTVDNME